MKRAFLGTGAAFLTLALAAPAAAADTRTAMGVDPKEPGRVVLWEEGLGLFLTPDGGGRWGKLSLAPREVTRIAIGDGGAIFLATDEGLLRSDDGGRTFSRPGGLPRDGRFVDVALAGTAIFAVAETGVFQSLDGGRTFRSAGVSGHAYHLYRIRSNPRFPAQVVIVSPALLDRSDDGGETWRRIPASPDFDYGSLAWSLGEPPVALAGNRQGLHRSSDGGETWKAISKSPPFIRGLWAPDPASDKYILVATHPQRGDESPDGGVPAKGLFRTLDGGKSWSGDLSPDGGIVLDLVFAPGRTEALYATTDLGGIFRSANRGDSWRQIAPPAK